MVTQCGSAPVALRLQNARGKQRPQRVGSRQQDARGVALLPASAESDRLAAGEKRPMRRRQVVPVMTIAVAMFATAGPSFGADPHAKHKPTDWAIWAYYPERAYRSGIQGQALISCGVDEQARLKPCGVLDEQPGNQDFGSAALKLASRDMINPPVGTPAQKDGYHVMLTFCVDPPGIYPTYPPSGPKPPCVK